MPHGTQSYHRAARQLAHILTAFGLSGIESCIEVTADVGNLDHGFADGGLCAILEITLPGLYGLASSDREDQCCD